MWLILLLNEKLNKYGVKWQKIEEWWRRGRRGQGD
jgi:hypothetical protein